MRLSLSTNWCNRRIEDGRAIADKALELGFIYEVVVNTFFLILARFPCRVCNNSLKVEPVFVFFCECRFATRAFTNYYNHSVSIGRPKIPSSIIVFSQLIAFT